MFAAGMGIPGPPQIFQTYLLPTLPFRRRRQSSETTNAIPTSSPPSSPSVGSSNSGGSPSSSLSSASPITPLSPSYTTPTDYDYDFDFSQVSHSRSDSDDRWLENGGFSSTTDNGTPTTMNRTRRPSYLSGSTSHISCSRCHADLALTSQIISKGFTGRHGRAYLVAASPCPLTSTPSTPGSASMGNYLSGSLPNTHTHKAVPRHLVTGLHTVCDISCCMCGSVLGWKYVGAEEETQRYKVGKFILETRRVTVGCCWENDAMGEDDDAEDVDPEDTDDYGDGAAGWRYSFETRRSSNARRLSVQQRQPQPCRRSISSTTNSGPSSGLGFGSLGLGLGLGFGSSGNSGPDKQTQSLAHEEEDDEEIVFDSQDEDECEDLFSGIWSPQLAKRRRSRKLSLR